MTLENLLTKLSSVINWFTTEFLSFCQSIINNDIIAILFGISIFLLLLYKVIDIVLSFFSFTHYQNASQRLSDKEIKKLHKSGIDLN